MGGKKERNVIGDMELLIRLLEIEWRCSKEPVWRVELPYRVIKVYNKELDVMNQHIHRLKEKDLEDTIEIAEKYSDWFKMMYATKQAYVLIRTGKKLLAAAKESVEKEQLVVELDDEEYKMVASRFSEYL